MLPLYHCSERIGWIPLQNEVPGTVVDEYRWIFGLSMTEMEIVHGAYRKDNPNCKEIKIHFEPRITGSLKSKY